jgi:hypothetical protein
MTSVTVPPKQVLDKPGTIRWAVGSEAGPRSMAWNVVGHTTANDVFIGLRERMHEIKLSLHSAKWRMAYTESGRKLHMPDGADRVLTRWEHTPELVRGWRRGATIVFALSNLGRGYSEKQVKGGGAVSFYPLPAEGWGLRFDVMLGAPDCDDITIRDAAADVGRVTLSSGAVVWVVATEVPVDATFEAGLAEVRRSAIAAYGGGPTARGWAWGTADEDDGPILIDLSNLPGPEPSL